MSRALVIGNKNYSSWSLRAWLALKVTGVAFEESRIALDRPQTKTEILRHSPSGKVPCLVDGSLVVWDSLAICETANERYAVGSLWPADPDARAHARAVTAEMHSGFVALRTHMSMDIRSSKLEAGAAAQGRSDVGADIQRIHAIWADCLARSGGPLLYGAFSIADAFYAPVVTRFRTYGVALDPPLAAYADTVFALQAMRQWVDAARAETEVLHY
jgi:glutathione S-transferase